jgi:hypothetical protein
VLPGEDPLDPESYEALLILDLRKIKVSFPQVDLRGSA